MKPINHFCLSSYLAFRYVAREGMEWLPGIGPKIPVEADVEQIPVGSTEEILATLQELVGRLLAVEKPAIFLSGGIDSAILAALLPEGSRAYTINFDAVTGANEAEQAARYAAAGDLQHTVVDVTWKDYQEFEPLLMKHKRAPLHAVEVALYKAAVRAREDGVQTVILGNGADSTFGGLNKLLSRDWTFEAFMGRYTFVEPAKVLEAPVSIRDIYLPYKRGDHIDYIGFLKKVHGLGVIQAFNNATRAAGMAVAEPFEEMKLKGELDIARIRAGEPKYLLVDVFRKLYPALAPPTKIPFARPMDEWLADYPGPASSVFKRDLDMAAFTGDQKYLIHGLDKFVRMLEAGNV